MAAETVCLRRLTRRQVVRFAINDIDALGDRFEMKRIDTVFPLAEMIEDVPLRDDPTSAEEGVAMSNDVLAVNPCDTVSVLILREDPNVTP